MWDVPAKGVSMRLRRVLVGVVVLAVLGSATVLGGPAQDVLADLARSERSARVAGGVAAIGVALKLYWHKIRTLIGFGKSIEAKDP